MCYVFVLSTNCRGMFVSGTTGSIGPQRGGILDQPLDYHTKQDIKFS